MAIDVERFRQTLVTERQRVTAAIENLHHENPGNLEESTGELVSGPDQHLGDVATETFDRQLDAGLEENAEHVLAAIDAALARIDAGTYGTCERCGNPISEERLEAIPYATLCIDCRRRAERG